MQINNSFLTIKKANPSSFRQGMVIEGIVSKIPGKKGHILLYKGNKIPVTLSDPGLEKATKFIVYKELGTVLLKPFNTEEAAIGKNGQGAALDIKSKILLDKIQAIFSFLDYKADDRIIKRMIKILQQKQGVISVLELLLFTADPARENVYKTLINIWKKYLKKMKKKSKESTDNKNNGKTVSLEDGPGSGEKSLIQKIKDVSLRVLKNKQRTGNQDQQQVFFSLLPIENESAPGILPLLYMAGGKNKKKAWLFTEIELSVLGWIGLALNQLGNVVQGSVFCQPGRKVIVQEALQKQKGLVIIEKNIDKGPFLEWAFEYLNHYSGKSYDKLA